MSFLINGIAFGSILAAISVRTKGRRDRAELDVHAAEAKAILFQEGIDELFNASKREAYKKGELQERRGWMSRGDDCRELAAKTARAEETVRQAKLQMRDPELTNEERVKLTVEIEDLEERIRHVRRYTDDVCLLSIGSRGVRTGLFPTKELSRGAWNGRWASDGDSCRGDRDCGQGTICIDPETGRRPEKDGYGLCSRWVPGIKSILEKSKKVSTGPLVHVPGTREESAEYRRAYPKPGREGSMTWKKRSRKDFTPRVQSEGRVVKPVEVPEEFMSEQEFRKRQEKGRQREDYKLAPQMREDGETIYKRGVIVRRKR